MSLVDYLIQPGEITPEAADRKRKMAMVLQQRGSDTSPVQHWAQGAARLSDAFFGALDEARVDRSEAAARAKAAEGESGLLGAFLGGAGTAPAAAGTAPSGGVAGALTGDIGNYAQAIANIESKGSGDYSALGPPTQKGDRAYGKYQVMGANIPQWTREALGQELTPQQFLASPQAQDAVFQHRFGKYVAQTGSPADAASMWFTGRPLADGGGARDQLGTSGAQYVSKFLAGLPTGGQQAPVQTAEAAPADVPAPGAQPAEFVAPGQPQQAQGQPQSAAVAMAVRMMNNPYASPVAKMIAQQMIARAGQQNDPLKQLQIQQLQNENSLFPLQQQKLQQELQGGSPIDVQSKQLGMQKTQAELGQVGKTGDINEYEYAKSSGAFTGTFPEYQKMIAEAKRSQVNIDQRAENAEEMARGQGMGKRLNEIADEGGKAQEDAVMFQRFGQLLGNVQTGGKTALLEGIRQLTNGAVTLDPNVDNVQALNAAVQYLAPRLRVPGTGAQSDAELRNFMNSVPTLAGQPGGNKIILDSLQGLVQYKLQRAEIAQAWQSGEISGKEATKRIQALPSPFANLPKVEERKAAPAKAPEGVDPKVWEFMTPEEKALWN